MRSSKDIKKRGLMNVPFSSILNLPVPVTPSTVKQIGL